MFYSLEGLLHRGCPLQHFGPSLQEISQGAQDLYAFGQKTAVKIHNAEKTLQLFDVPRGWAKFNFSDVIGRGGAAPSAEIEWPRISKEGLQKHIFKD
jgi:hypothetical protein